MFNNSILLLPASLFKVFYTNNQHKLTTIEMLWLADWLAYEGILTTLDKETAWYGVMRATHYVAWIGGYKIGRNSV